MPERVSLDPQIQKVLNRGIQPFQFFSWNRIVCIIKLPKPRKNAVGQIQSSADSLTLGCIENHPPPMNFRILEIAGFSSRVHGSRFSFEFIRNFETPRAKKTSSVMILPFFGSTFSPMPSIARVGFLYIRNLYRQLNYHFLTSGHPLRRCSCLKSFCHDPSIMENSLA